jgi:hypothetical protein
VRASASTPQPWNPVYMQDKLINPRFICHPGYIPDKFGMLDKSGIYPGYIWDISGIYPGYINIPDKSWMYPKYIPEYILNISGMYSQIYLGFQGWGGIRDFVCLLVRRSVGRFAPGELAPGLSFALVSQNVDCHCQNKVSKFRIASIKSTYGRL